MQPDLLSRFLFNQLPIRGQHILLSNAFQIIIHQHKYPLVLQKLLGEALCVVGLLTSIVKFDSRITVQFRGNGPLRLLLAQCDKNFRIRGLAKWEGDFLNADLADALHQGLLVVIVDSGKKGHYQGIVDWVGNSLTESIEAYFRLSEQIATKIWLHVDTYQAQGLMLQKVPTNFENMNQEQMLEKAWQYRLDLTSKKDPAQFFKTPYPALLSSLYPEDDIRLFPSQEMQFGCTCSRERSENAIVLLGKEEAQAEIDAKNSLVVTCDFCNQEYVFDKVDVAAIFATKTKAPPKDQFH